MTNPVSSHSTTTPHVVLPLAGENQRTRGLPAREDLRELALTYLTRQRECWPELVGTPILPQVTEQSLDAMVTQFETSYESGRLSASGDLTAAHAKTIEIGAAYIRYSAAISNTRSLDQQLNNALQTARREHVFIPWQYVFADAAISGTTVLRNGYQILRELVQSTSTTVNRIFVEDLDRLHRDQIESLQFVRLLDLHGKRLTTANGFDSTQQMSKVTHSFKAMQNEFFVDQLKEKVVRGMKDEFARGQNLGQPPTGFKVVPERDASGEVIINRQGKCETKIVIDEEAADIIRRIFSMFADQKMSPQHIARALCKEYALGRDGWNGSTIGRFLRNERYIGIYVWGRRRTTKNPVTGRRKDVLRPESEHLRLETPELRIISDDLWQATQKRLAEVARNTRPAIPSKRSKQSVYPTRFFDLYCRYCDKPLWLSRAGKYSHVCCRRAKEGSANCELRTNKTLSIIDECILAFIKEQVLDQAGIDSLLEQANAFLIEEAAKPTTDTAELNSQIQGEKDRIKRLTQRLVILGDGVAAETLMQSIVVAQDALTRLQEELAIASSVNFRPEVIDRAALTTLLTKLRELMLEDVVSSHHVLAKALGRVYITQGPKRGQHHAWIAEININPIPVFLEIAKKNDCPTTRSLDYLQTRSWTIASPFQIEISNRGVHHKIDPNSPNYEPNIKSQ